ncbi:hypothetical protein CDAR_265291 [Caerostris darwini]|uniref:Uncharacterized protein n=1 Tax=Caerostris darwini TaxID=1538125 RepID=A0AAV4W4W6_9ARAC|nr:hypothetical protein CDAR_265291 [Caerostris darwini]
MYSMLNELSNQLSELCVHEALKRDGGIDFDTGYVIMNQNSQQKCQGKGALNECQHFSLLEFIQYLLCKNLLRDFLCRHTYTQKKGGGRQCRQRCPPTSRRMRAVLQLTYRRPQSINCGGGVMGVGR